MPKVIGQYRITEKIAEGGFGTTYKGEHIRLKAPVCIKHCPQISPEMDEILAATKLVIEKDPEATVGSRILLSTFHDPVPSCADFSELAWLHDIGYRRVLLCDEMCLKEGPLATAVGAFEAFRESYPRKST